jgi:phospholipid/cholesterol/gamma-HCH transport system ATP-binding protein
MTDEAPEIIIAVREVVNRFGTQLVHDGVSFEVRRGEVFGIVGGSGSGKSVLLRTMLGLRRPDSGTVEVEGRDITRLDDQELRAVKRRYGVTFQHGALFTSLTVNENIILPLVEAQPLSEAGLQSLAELRLRMVGLAVEAGAAYAAWLWGGMI